MKIKKLCDLNCTEKKIPLLLLFIHFIEIDLIETFDLLFLIRSFTP